MNFTRLIAVCAIAAVATAPATGQEQPAAGSAVDDRAVVICMIAQTQRVASVQDGATPPPITIIANERSARSLVAKRFAPTPCEASNLATASSRAVWRDDICELASFGNVAVQNQFEAAMGERPAVLCALAEQAAGAWDRRTAKGIRTTR